MPYINPFFQYQIMFDTLYRPINCKERNVMNLKQIRAMRVKCEEELLDLEDIIFEESIPQEEREHLIGVYWHTPEEIQEAKRCKAKLEKKVASLYEQETLAMLSGYRC